MDWRRLEASREAAPPASASELRPSIRDFTQYLGAARSTLAVIPLLVRAAGGHARAGDVAALARALDDLEVPALAVATAPESGSLEDLAAVASAVSAPVLRWDCVAGEDRLYESRLAGADAVLIPADVAGDALPRLVTLARAIHVASLVEVRTAADVAAAVAARPPVLAVAAGALAVAAEIPSRFPVVAAEAIDGPDDLRRVYGHADAVLVAVPIGAVEVAFARIRALVDAAAALRS